MELFDNGNEFAEATLRRESIEVIKAEVYIILCMGKVVGYESLNIVHVLHVQFQGTYTRVATLLVHPFLRPE